MSERKEEEEMVEHGSSPESSESEHMYDAEVEQHEAFQLGEHDNPSGNSYQENTSGNSESPPSDNCHKVVESAGETQLNGYASSPPKPTVDGAFIPDEGKVDASNHDDGKEEGNLMVEEGNASLVQTEVVVVPVGEGIPDTKKADGIEEELKNLQESKNMEESNNVENSKDVNELQGADAVKNEVHAEAENHLPEENGVKEGSIVKHESASLPYTINTEGSNQSFPSTLYMTDGDDGTDEEQAAFAKELDNFFRERGLEFKHPKFYGEGLNCLKLWRAVTRLGGYDRVTACKLWRQVGESFHPPKTCTTVSWSFRIFYEKALLDYERHKMRGGELVIPASPLPEPMSVENQMVGAGSGRARRDAAARAMQGWHSQRLLGNGEVGDPIIRDKNSLSTPKREKQLKSVGLLKRKKPSSLDRSAKAARTLTKVVKPQIDTDVADVGPAADWVKISVRRTKDCFEVYALVPGLLREEVRVQSDPAGRLVISGDPEQPDNPWGVTPFKKVITLPSRIDPHQTSAVVTLHGQLFVRVPFEQSDL